MFEYGEYRSVYALLILWKFNLCFLFFYNVYELIKIHWIQQISLTFNLLIAIFRDHVEFVNPRFMLIFRITSACVANTEAHLQIWMSNIFENFNFF